MKKYLLSLVLLWWIILPLNFAMADRYDDDLDRTTRNISDHVARPGSWGIWGETQIKNFLIYLWQRVLLPMLIIIAVLLALIGFYKLMFSDSDEESKKAKDYITYWVIGIVMMSMAWYIWAQLVWDEWTRWAYNFGWGDFDGVLAAQKIYMDIAYPLLKIVVYITAGILFVTLLIHFMQFVWKPEEDITKKTKNILIRNSVWILVILMANKIVETVFGDVQNSAGRVRNLWDIWEWLLTNKNFDFLYTVLNRFMGLLSFFILIMIVWQAFEILIKPWDQEWVKKIWKSFVYIFIWLILMGAAYLVSNFFIIK